MDTLTPKSKILEASNKGLDIILSYYPDAEKSVNNNKPFKIRDEKTASAQLWFCKNTDSWKVKDFGGSDRALNALDITMREENIDFSEACQKWASHYNLTQFTPTIYLPDLDFSTAKDGEKEGDYDLMYLPEIPKWALKILGVHVTQKICDKYHLNFVESVTTVFVNSKTGKLTKLVKKSTEHYPIFAFDNGDWIKMYEPKAKEKHRRFYSFGTKPERFIFGLEQLRKAVKEHRRDFIGDQEVDRATLKIDNVIIATGGSDGLNIASLGYEYNVIWFNSESEHLNYKEYQELKKDVENIYNCPDIDQTGVEQAVKLGNFFLDIKHIWLPQELLFKKDFRGNPRKDIRDFIEVYYRKDDPFAICKKFDNLVRTALPFQFWDAYKANKVTKYRFNSTHAFHFLKHQGFYKLEDITEKQGYAFIKVEENRVKKVSHVDVKDYVNRFLEKQHSPIPLRNMVYDTTKLNEKQLSQLTYRTIDFNDATQESQYLFFNNCTWLVTKQDIVKLYNKDSKKMVWDDKVLDHNVKLQEPHFKIDATDPTKCSIDVLKTDNKFFNYLINTSRMYWKNELERPFENDLEGKQSYYKAHQFDISGPKLTAIEQQEQQQHLVNKIYALGYFLHKYKDDSKAFFVYAMDNKISDLDESHGGSGKSITWNKAVRQVLKRVHYMEGRNKEMIEDKFAFDGVTKEVDGIIFDDINAYFDFNRHFSSVTGSMKINPKNNKPYEIPFEDSPKLCATSNYQLKNLDPSTLRRLLFTVYSDYYHFNKSGEYNEHRRVSDDFDGKNLFTHFDQNDWNDFYNFIAQCIQFYLSQPNKIDPPMENVLKRNLKRVAGDSFSDWADGYFNIESEYLNCYFPRKKAFDHYKDVVGKTAKTANNFKKSLDAWCKFKGYEFNPVDQIPIDSEGKQRKVMSVENKTQEVFFIRVKFDESSTQEDLFTPEELAEEDNNEMPF